MNILLIQPHSTKIAAVGDFNVFEPLALEYIAAGIKDSHKVEILDLRFDKNLEDTLKRFSPNIVGITGYTIHVNICKEILRKVKGFNKDILIVVGGHHATVAPEDFNDDAVDLIVIGEGILTFKEIVTNFEKGNNFEEIEGIAIRKDGRIRKTKPRQYTNLDNLPFPDRTINQAHRKYYKIGNHGPIALLRNSIGCKFRCIYCAQWKVTNEKYLTREPNLVLKEISTIKEPYIYFADDEAFLDTKRSFTLADLIDKAGIKKQYHLFTRADTIAKHPDLIKRWKEIGLSDVIVGFECFTDEELKFLHKGTYAYINEEAMRILKKNKITNHATIMVLPDYDYNKFIELRRFVRRHNYIYPKFPILTPFPGTALFEQNKSRILSFNYALYDFKHALLPTKLPLKDFYKEYGELHRKAIPLWLHIVRLLRFRLKEIIPTIIKSRRILTRISKGYDDAI